MGTSKRKSKPEDQSNAPYKFTSSITESHRQHVYGAAFNQYVRDSGPKGAYLATCAGKYLTIYRLNLGEKKIDAVMQFVDENPAESYYAVCWAVDTKVRRHLVVIGGCKGIIRVVDPLSKETCNTLRGHGDSVNELRTSPTNAMIIASASKDRTARIWNIRNSDCLAIFGGAYGHLDEVISLDFDNEMKFLLTTSMDHTVRVWDLQSSLDRIKSSLEDDDLPPATPAIENHFPFAVSRDVHTNYVDCGRFLGSFILSKSCENMIALWKFGGFDLGPAGEGTLLRTETYVMHTAWLSLPHAETWFLKFDLHPRNEYVACGNEKGDVHLWELSGDTLKLQESDYTLSCQDGGSCVRQVVFSPDGKILIAVGDNGHIQRYDLA